MRLHIMGTVASLAVALVGCGSEVITHGGEGGSLPAPSVPDACPQTCGGLAYSSFGMVAGETCIDGACVQLHHSRATYVSGDAFAKAGLERILSGSSPPDDVVLDGDCMVFGSAESDDFHPGELEDRGVTLTTPYGDIALDVDLPLNNLTPPLGEGDEITATFSGGTLTGTLSAVVAGLDLVEVDPVVPGEPTVARWSATEGVDEVIVRMSHAFDTPWRVACRWNANAGEGTVPGEWTGLFDPDKTLYVSVTSLVVEQMVVDDEALDLNVRRVYTITP